MIWTKPVVMLAALRLGLNFLRVALWSGIDTARLILQKGASASGELVVMPFDGLSENSAVLLGALITLTPGTTLVSIDTERSEFVLHLLEPSRRDQTFADIERYFCAPLRQICEARDA